MRSLASSIKFSREPISFPWKALPANAMRSRIVGTGVDILPRCRVMESDSLGFDPRIKASRLFL
jgi:hypothetical protein